jgi:hypothetical protein
MAHYAKILDDKVVTVIVCDSTPLQEGEWIQTSYNTRGNQHLLNGTPLRGNYAGIGYTYDRTNDVFYTQQPYASWTLNQSTWSWEAPTPFPTDDPTKSYRWNESTTSWDVVE